MKYQDERHKDESDSTYFMRVFKAAEKRYPKMEERLLHLGAYLATGLPCVHPVNCQEYRSTLGNVPILEFLASEPSGRRDDPEYRARVWGHVFCTVCGVHAPDGPTPVDKFWT